VKKFKLYLIWALATAFVVFYLWPPAKYEPHQVSPEYQAQVDEFFIPPMPDGWEFDKFVTRDFVKLRFGKGPVNPDAKATLIVMPGFTGLLEQYGEQLTHWQEQGYNVAGIDIRGQGGSERPLKENPEKSWVKDFSIYSDDIAELLNEEFSGRDEPIILIGQSFGAHVAYRTVAEHDVDVDGLLLTVPAFKPNTGEFSYGAAKMMYRLSKILNKSKFYAPGATNWKPDVPDMTQKIACSAEPKRVYIRDAVYTNNPELRMGTATYQWFGQTMISGEKMVKPEWTSRINIPVVMMLADRDQIVINEPPKEACAAIDNCEIVIIEDSGHCVMQEVDRIVENVYDNVDNLVAEIRPANGLLPAGK
jgi:lysophospholipase